MSSVYADPAVRRRLTEFLGGDELEHATAVYITNSDRCQFDLRELRAPLELDYYLTNELDIARSLADSSSILLHLDIEYVNFDSPAEAYLDPLRTFALQEPVVRVILALLRQWGIHPLHLLTGQGHHFVWRIARTSATAIHLLELCPAPELLESCAQRVPQGHTQIINDEAHRTFAAISLLMEFLAHRIRELASPLTEIPVEITAVHVGCSTTKQREIISIDISEYGDPLHTRMVRMPFTRYLKPWLSGLAHSLGIEKRIPRFLAIPLHQMDTKLALQLRQVEKQVCDLAQRTCMQIPQCETGTQALLNEYLGSPLRQFHKYFYSDQHDAKASWHETYDRTPMAVLPPCARHVVMWPNDILLKPAGMQLITRCLQAAKWHPRHIAGFIRSKFENPVFHWGVNWAAYVPAIRADFYTRLFAGLYATGHDPLIDFNCTSTREKGFCFSCAPNEQKTLGPIRQILLPS